MSSASLLRLQPLSGEAQRNTDQQQQFELFKVFLATTQHFFGGFEQLFHSVRDPRDPARISYSLTALGCEGVLLFLCRLGSRRQLTQLLRDNDAVADKFQALFGVASCAHGDTLNDLCARLDPAQMQAVVTSMSAGLIRQKVLYAYRLRGHYYVIGIDGTGTLSFHQRHCAHCLTRTSGGQTLYYHHVLEAKLLTTNGFAFSLMTEFIENAGENPDKQDCELKAFARLSERLKQRFPRLPICLSLDALFAGGPTFERCQRYGWKYLIVLTADDLPKVNREFESLCRLSPGDHLRVATGHQAEIQQDFRWAHDIAYVDSEQREHTLSVIECLETKPDEQDQPQITCFKWVTNFKVKAKNVSDLANQGGRLRWKFENEGFNIEKNGGYELEHAYTQNANAGKVFYFFLQIARLLSQLMEKGSRFRQAFPNGVGSAKNIAYRLLEAWRNLRVSGRELQHILAARFQIRFDSS